MDTWRCCRVCALLLEVFLLAACAANPSTVPAPAITSTPRSVPAVSASPGLVGPAKWNTQDPNANNNGNSRLAVGLLNATTGVSERAEVVVPAALGRSPWNYYGKPLRLSGTVLVARDLPHGGQTARDLGVEQVGELVLATEDGTRLVYTQLGSIDSLQSGQKVSVYGYVAGLVDAEDGTGGRMSAPLLIGKTIEKL